MIIPELVDRCNLKCALCWNRNRVGSMEQMSLTTVEKVVKRFGKGANYTWYNWGEPLLYDKFPEFANIVKGTRTTISSNFSLRLSDRHFEALEKFEKVVLSMSGMTEEIYRIYHRGGNFQLVMENLQRLRNGMRKVMIHWIRHKYNRHQDEACKEMCKEYGFLYGPVEPNCEVEDLVDGFDSELLKFPKFHLNRRMTVCRLLNWVPISTSGEYLLCCTTHNVKTRYTIDDSISMEELRVAKMELPLCKTCQEKQYWRMF